MKHIKLFEELWHPAKFDVKYYWRVTINRLQDFFKECNIEREDGEDVISLTISLGSKSCEVKFESVNCFLNGEKVDTHRSFFKKIGKCLGLSHT